MECRNEVTVVKVEKKKGTKDEMANGKNYLSRDANKESMK